MARKWSRFEKWTKFEKWTNIPKADSIGPHDVAEEFELLRREKMRLRGISKKRIERSKEQGFDNILIGVDRTIPMTVKELQALPKQRQYDELEALRSEVDDLHKALNRQLSTVSGIKAYLTEHKGINFSKPLTSGEQTIVQAFNTNTDLVMLQAHLSIQELMDDIDASTDLSDDEKEDLKRFLRQKLNGDKPDYDSQIPGMTIEEIIEKYPEYQDVLRKAEEAAIANFNMDSANLTNSTTTIF